MKLLFISFYYPPDLSAGSFRSFSLIEALLSKLPETTNIDIITTLPNRYSSFNSDLPEFDKQNAVKILRIKLPKHKSGMIDQAIAFYVFRKKALKAVEGKDYDLVYATSSRLMTAMLGANIAKKLNKPLYLDMRDIFVDSIKDILQTFELVISAIFLRIEKYSTKGQRGEFGF